MPRRRGVSRPDIFNFTVLLCLKSRSFAVKIKFFIAFIKPGKMFVALFFLKLNTKCAGILHSKLLKIVYTFGR